jgi:hypothetical protein
VATGASAAGEGDVTARINGQAIILILDVGTGDVHASG